MYLSSLIKVRKGTIESFSISSKTPKDVLEDHDLNTRWYLELLDKSTNKYTTIDLSIIFTETNLCKCSSWEEFASNLNDSIIIPYTVTLPDQHSKNLIATHILNNLDFDLSYCNMAIPEDRNIRQFRWRMPDLAITKIKSTNTTNLKNCICSINGIISLPIFYNGELFIKNGARYMKTTTDLNHPSVVLMDFSELGDITIVPFKDCSTKHYSDVSRTIDNCDIKFYLPSDIDVTSKTVFPVIAHSLFFPTDVTITSSNSVVISPYKLPIRTSLFKVYQQEEKYLNNTTSIKLSTNIDNYINEEMFDSDYYGNFFIIVDNPKIFITKTHASNYASSVYSSTKHDGILFNQSTQSFFDYVGVPYDSLVDLYTNRVESLYECDLPYDKDCFGLVGWECVHKEELFNIHKKDLYLLNFFGV